MQLHDRLLNRYIIKKKTFINISFFKPNSIQDIKLENEGKKKFILDILLTYGLILWLIIGEANCLGFSVWLAESAIWERSNKAECKPLLMH